MTTPTQQPAALSGLLARIDAAIERITTGRAPMRVPAESTDPDLVLADCKRALLSAQAQPQPARALPHPASPEASAMIDYLLSEYNWPANQTNAARAGWEAANRWLAAPTVPAQAAPSDTTEEPAGVPSLSRAEWQEILDLLAKDHDGSDFEPECPACTAHRTVKEWLAARAFSPAGAAQDAQGATSKPEADAAPRGAKQLRRMPNSDMVEAGRKAMEPEKFVSHCRTLWVWNAMWDAAPEVATPDMDYGGPTAHDQQDGIGNA